MVSEKANDIQQFFFYYKQLSISRMKNFLATYKQAGLNDEIIARLPHHLEGCPVALLLAVRLEDLALSFPNCPLDLIISSFIGCYLYRLHWNVSSGVGFAFELSLMLVSFLSSLSYPLLQFCNHTVSTVSPLSDS